MDYKKLYEKAVERAKTLTNSGFNDFDFVKHIFPELAESEDEKIRKGIIRNLEYLMDRAEGFVKDELKERIAWLEKQGNTNETIKRNEFAQGVLKGAAINLITWIDYNAAEGNMCLSNMECKDIEDALVSGDWDKIYAYIKKKLEKQGEQKSAEFKPLFRVGDVIKPKDPVLGEPRIIKGIHPKFGYDTNNGILDFEFEDNWELVEQKPADKVEPKFHESDWVIDKQGIVHQIANVIKNVTYNTYGYDIVGGGYFNDNTEGVRLWTIQDAKSGNVLATKAGDIFIYKELLYDKPFTYCGIDKFGVFKDCNCGDGLDWTPYLSDVTPATKEQCNILEKAMADAGYTFNFEKKELKKIEPKPADKEMKELLRTEYEKGRADAIAEMQKPWSEEDERNA